MISNRKCRRLIWVRKGKRRRLIRGNKRVSRERLGMSDIGEGSLVGSLERLEQGGVKDDVGMLGEVGVRLVFLAEVGFAEPDKHAGVAL